MKQPRNCTAVIYLFPGWRNLPIVDTGEYFLQLCRHHHQPLYSPLQIQQLLSDHVQQQVVPLDLLEQHHVQRGGVHR